MRQQTSDRISVRPEPRGSRFWTSKTVLLSQVAQKSGSEAGRSILSRTCRLYLDRPGPKEGCQKKRRTDNFTQDWARSGGRRVPALDLENACQPASSSENRSRHQVPNSLNNPIKEHLRHTHSSALARSCAFSAITGLIMS